MYYDCSCFIGTVSERYLAYCVNVVVVYDSRVLLLVYVCSILGFFMLAFVIICKQSLTGSSSRITLHLKLLVLIIFLRQTPKY